MFFNLFKKKEAVDNKPQDMGKKTVWKPRKRNDILIYMCNLLSGKSDFGDKMELLSDEERIFYITTEVECEVNNDGFEQFLYGGSGKFAPEASDAFRTVGADKMAEICDKAFSALGSPIPTDHRERVDFLDKVLTDEIREVLKKCDDEFYSYPDDLNELNYQYILANKDKFEYDQD